MNYYTHPKTLIIQGVQHFWLYRLPQIWLHRLYNKSDYKGCPTGHTECQKIWLCRVTELSDKTSIWLFNEFDWTGQSTNVCIQSVHQFWSHTLSNKSECEGSLTPIWLFNISCSGCSSNLIKRNRLYMVSNTADHRGFQWIWL